MRWRLAIFLGAVLFVGGCDRSGDGGVPPGAVTAASVPKPAEQPSLLLVRGPETFRCEASAARRKDDPAIEILVQGESGSVLARGPGDEPLCFDLPLAQGGCIRTTVRYASGVERHRETTLP